MKLLTAMLLIIFSIQNSRAQHLEEVNLQEQLIQEARNARPGLVPEPSPEGKTIEKIVIFNQKVISSADPWPDLLNLFHRTTQEDVVKRELLFQEGDKWRAEVIDETSRNLEQNLFIALTEIRAMKGSQPDRVIALVASKDLWSLRVNWDVSIVRSTLENLAIQLTEKNLGGRDREVSIDFQRGLGTTSLGQTFADPWFVWDRVVLTEKLGVDFNRATGKAEGGFVTLGIKRPLYRLSTEWAWGISAGTERNFFRLFSNARLTTVTSPTTGESLPYVYESRQTAIHADVTRSFGFFHKQNVSFGWRLRVKDFNIPTPPLPVQAATLEDFRQGQLPRSERSGLLFLNYLYYTANYIKEMDIETYSIVEDIRLGPRLELEARWASPAFGFHSRFGEALADLSWTWKASGHHINARVIGFSRYQPEIALSETWINRWLELSAKETTPLYGPVRFVTSGRLARRAFDLNRTIYALGGESTPRGYPSRSFTGGNLLGFNEEIRTLPLRLPIAHIGAVAFFDVGDAFDDPSQIQLHPSVGGGLRILFPQFNRELLRIDFGIPLESVTGGGFFDYFIVKFGQAF